MFYLISYFKANLTCSFLHLIFIQFLTDTNKFKYELESFQILDLFRVKIILYKDYKVHDSKRIGKYEMGSCLKKSLHIGHIGQVQETFFETYL